jgi:hypothetical protein
MVGFLIGLLPALYKKNRHNLVYKNFKTRNKYQRTSPNYNSNKLFKEVGLDLFPINDLIVGYKNIDTTVV